MRKRKPLKGLPGCYIDRNGRIYQGDRLLPTQRTQSQGRFVVIPSKGFDRLVQITPQLIAEHFPPPSPHGNATPIVAFTVYGKYVGAYSSQRDFAKQMENKVSESGISGVLRGRLKQCKGFIFFYKHRYDALEIKPGNFPHDLYHERGYTLNSFKNG